MSYHIYTTKGIVLRNSGVGEADRIYTIFTRELGKVYARAIGVRKSDSKLRGNLESYSLSSVSFVKGKDFWRITSSQLVKNIPPIPTITKPLNLLDRLIQGEEAHPELFDEIEQSLALGGVSEDFEIELAAKILFHLGYLQKSDLELDKKSLIQAINKGLEASHLT